MQNGLLPHLATVVREAREGVGKKRSHCAAAADLDQSAITRFEGAKAWPRDPDEMINAYASVIGIEPLGLWRQAVDRWTEA